MRQTKPHIFKTFPEFSKLTLVDKESYQALIADYPAYAEFSFPFLKTWWSGQGGCSISQLNGNLIISYWFPGHEEYSGLSVLGTKKLDETIATIFDYQKEKGDPARLVHVPEFVISNLHYPELFSFASERNYDECVLSIAKLKILGKLIRYRRGKIRKILNEKNKIVLKRLDLNIPGNRDLLLRKAEEWPKTGLNDICEYEIDALERSIRRAEVLGLDNACLFIDGELQAYNLYERAADPRYIIINFGRFNYDLPYIFELNALTSSQWFFEQGIEFINIKYDLGISRLRVNKLAFGPSNFLRKYTLTPSD